MGSDSNRIFAGTSGWAYATWKPGFYPPKLASKNFLAHYATRLNSVEVNYTFRRVASPTLLQGWIAATGSNFQFAIKAHQTITHIKPLRGAEEALDKFVSSLEPLRVAEKLGPVLFQLPPNLKCDASRLRDFLATLPKWLRAAFEFRHESWFNDEIYDALKKSNAALCLAESDELATPEIQTADFHYLRLRKAANNLKAAQKKVRKLAADGPVYVYFKHEDTAEGALQAEALLQQK
ncbi:MAG TPA: DUF72 domain-containing protein [Candidatus Acidoferrales bacterium]